ncbi:MAG: SDR family oxidoreductase [Gemmatimonadetes bacterium]|nr:MAG: SDR family oxidoreductase [Gemmatimonadota bacterium]
MDLGLASRTAVVTGASQGLGLGIATALAREGATLVLNARDEDRLLQAASALAEQSGARVLTVAGDVRTAATHERLVRTAVDETGRLDVLVTNGGGPRGGDMDALSRADYEAAVALVLQPVVDLVYAALPPMIEAGWGRIVAVTSVSAKQPIPGLTLSNVTRPAVIGFLKSISRELAPRGVTCNAVAPGYTATPRVEAWLRDGVAGRSGEDVRADLMRDIPAGRIAEPIEIGDAVAFLASERAAYITGQTLAVDGGYVKGLL